MRLNDLDFHVEIDGSGPPLLMLHGFTGSARAWDEARPALADVVTTISIDLIGHGRSGAPEDPQRYSLDACARDLAALLDFLDLPTVRVLGYSMGGRVALHFAMAMPKRVSTLVLESASPGIDDADERQRRVGSDAALAQRILRHGIEAFVAEWESVPLLAAAPHVSADRLAHQHALRLQNRPLGLANSLRGMGAGQQLPLWSRLHELTQPVLLIVGGLDSRYRQIAERMQPLLPACEVAVVPDAGHTVHVDQPPAFANLLRSAVITN
jgi:2-succinyl-6-hydroxy-2,4-cyclohexadiene-1-carboxylate synthase